VAGGFEESFRGRGAEVAADPFDKKTIYDFKGFAKRPSQSLEECGIGL